MHKLHQMCFIVHGMQCSDLSDMEEIQGVALSLLPLAVVEKLVPAKSFFTLLAAKLCKLFTEGASYKY